ncbi:CLUMA_CG015917, isoform A, partial [Clunio marinus]
NLVNIFVKSFNIIICILKIVNFVCSRSYSRIFLKLYDCQLEFERNKISTVTKLQYIATSLCAIFHIIFMAFAICYSLHLSSYRLQFYQAG